MTASSPSSMIGISVTRGVRNRLRAFNFSLTFFLAWALDQMKVTPEPGETFVVPRRGTDRAAGRRKRGTSVSLLALILKKKRRAGENPGERAVGWWASRHKLIKFNKLS